MTTPITNTSKIIYTREIIQRLKVLQQLEQEHSLSSDEKEELAVLEGLMFKVTRQHFGYDEGGAFLTLGYPNELIHHAHFLDYINSLPIHNNGLSISDVLNRENITENMLTSNTFLPVDFNGVTYLYSDVGGAGNTMINI